MSPAATAEQFSMLPTRIRDQLTSIGRETHRLMSIAADQKGFARSRVTIDRCRGIRAEGYTIAGTVASYVRAASSNLGGEPLTKDDIALVRQYLKASGNVIVLDRIEPDDDNPQRFMFRIFVSATFHDAIPVPVIARPHREPDAIDDRARRLTPTEAGEDREPAPVQTRKVTPVTTPTTTTSTDTDDERHLTSRERILFLRDLDTYGPFADAAGYVNRNIRQTLGLTDAQSKQVSSWTGDFARRGWLIKRTKGKRTFRLEVTDLGRQVLAHPAPHLHGVDGLSWWLATVGEFRHDHAGTFCETLDNEADLAINASHTRVLLNNLIDEGLVEPTYTEGSSDHMSFLRAVKWVGPEPAIPMPGAVDEDEVRFLPEPEPESTPTWQTEVTIEQTTPTTATDTVDDISQALSTLVARTVEERVGEYVRLLGEVDELRGQIRTILGRFTDGDLTTLGALSEIETLVSE